MFGRILSLGSVALLLGAAPTSGQCQIQKLTGSHTQAFDYFGKAAAIDGNTIVVGAYAVNNGNPGDAYVFELQNGVWTQTARLSPPDGGGNDQFGNSVGISGDTIVIGSEFNTNELGSNAGAAYVYERGVSGWALVDKLLASDGDGQPKFAEVVAAGNDGNLIVAGRRQDQDGGNNVGAAYVFEKIGGAWVETAKLKASNGQRNDLFGDNIAVDGERILVGSYRSDPMGGNSGSAYIYEKVGGTWTEMDQLISLDGGGELGRGVALDGDRALLGARYNNGTGAGYIFELVGGEWIQTAKLVPQEAGDGDWCGEAVALEGTRAIVSGHKNDFKGLNSGRAFLFELVNGSWVETAAFAPNDVASLDEFSHAVALSGDTAILTSPFDNFNTGSAYVYGFGDCTPVASIRQYGLDLGGANIALLDSPSTPLAGQSMLLDVTSPSADNFGLLWVSLRRVRMAFRGGTMLADLSVTPVRLPFAFLSGAAQIEWNIPPLAAGRTVFLQAAVFDTTQPGGVALTNGLELIIGE